MDATLGRLVRERAGNRCEYCRLPQAWTRVPLEIDDVIARKHRGETPGADGYRQPLPELFFCNSHKGSDIRSLDPDTGKLTPLFHPRRHKWTRHFRWHRAYLIGRVTVALLHINDDYRVELREGLIDEGLFPPE